MVNYGRTDLASEARTLRCRGGARELPGVAFRQEQLRGLSVTAVEILDEQGAQRLGKPIGHYYTLELPDRFERGTALFPEAAAAIGELVARCLSHKTPKLVLIAALGNPDITPDALGSLAASGILVTRHLKKQRPADFRFFTATALCRTGVLGTTGVESAAQVRMLCRELCPDCVIAIDALAGAEFSRLCRTVQICDAGIAPGSGVGNDREALDRDALGVPVVAVGVPTVMDASLLSRDPAMAAMFVTPRSIDSDVRAAARLIAYGIDLALHRELSVADIDMLVG